VRGILSYGASVPHSRLQRSAIGSFLGSGGANGTRSVASFDEDTSTLAVAAGRQALTGAPQPPEALQPEALQPEALWFATAEPTYLEKSNAGVIHAALRLDESVPALDFGGAARSGLGALVAAARSTQRVLVAAADIRTGLPGSPDEVDGGDAGAALLLGDESDGPLLAEFLGSASASREFLDRWRLPDETNTRAWEERFGEGELTAAALGALNALLEDLGLPRGDVAELIVTGCSGRAVKAVGRKVGADADPLASTVGNTGGTHPLLRLIDALERHPAGATIVVLHLADGADAVAFRATGSTAEHSDRRTIAEQVATGDDGLAYSRFMAWRGVLTQQPPNRPPPTARRPPPPHGTPTGSTALSAAATAAAAPCTCPRPGCRSRGQALDDMEPAPMADVQATVVTFTVDKLVYSMSPPVVFAVVDFDGGGRLPVELTDCRPDEVEVGSKVEMTFRRLNMAEGIANYFWKGRLVRTGEEAGAQS
jgi:hydroxymethylglutaryl-CoA synthase